ncbi:MAG: class I SAM-dependent methyltransferase family protein [Candidatus Bathyarchaeota archaeon]|nr:class I SAM-dependent methyltransferase family protein [Candidatus Bathyarchaeota archaeon]
MRPDSEGEHLPVESPCIKVPKKSGVKAIDLAAHLNLLNRDLRVSLEGEYLCVPLIKKPTGVDAEKIVTVLPESKITTRDFRKRSKYPPTAIDFARELLPRDLIDFFPSSMDFVGDIVIVEVPSQLESYKKTLGEIILRSHRNVRTVLAKAGAVGGARRLRRFELLAGQDRTQTVHREHGCIYYLDLAKVYFSPRLSFEHNRVASQVVEGETVIDMFAGIGPFSILIAKKHVGVKVYAIDLNPEAVEYLQRNIIANRVHERIVPIIGDAKEVVPSRLAKSADRVIMNLPDRAIDFLSPACDALKPRGGIIHLYHFESGPNPIETARRKLSETVERIGYKIQNVPLARVVREVSPYRYQVVLDVEMAGHSIRG